MILKMSILLMRATGCLQPVRGCRGPRARVEDNRWQPSARLSSGHGSAGRGCCQAQEDCCGVLRGADEDLAASVVAAGDIRGLDRDSRARGEEHGRHEELGRAVLGAV